MYNTCNYSSPQNIMLSIGKLFLIEEVKNMNFSGRRWSSQLESSGQHHEVAESCCAGFELYWFQQL